MSYSVLDTPDLWDSDWDAEWSVIKAIWKDYRNGLLALSDKLPQGARLYALGGAHNSNTEESPHDSWLSSVQVRTQWCRRQGRLGRGRCDIFVRLLGSYHNGYIDFTYRGVRHYSITDAFEWLYDMVSLAPGGHVVHEIRFEGNNRWTIECDDFTCTWTPSEPPAPPELRRVPRKSKSHRNKEMGPRP